MRVRAVARIWALLALIGASLPAAVSASAASKVVRYHRYSVRVPRTWPVYDLSREPTVCVRFDRHAVYLGPPSSRQQCPAHAAGRTEAIWIQPLTARGASVALPSSPRQAELVRDGVSVTATWGTQPRTVERALGVRSLAHIRMATAAAATATVRATAASLFTGRGFDACSAPSAARMAAWGSSPYRAVGIYIGGTNMACSQPNLTPAWVRAESAAGWHLIPTYVGLQATSNTCGCAGINPSEAPAQGRAAATNAVAAARSLGLGPGNPVYFDMEAYSRGGTNTSAVLAFLSAWTSQLHAAGYVSGVYSSASSGISDLVAHVGTGFNEPDDIWIADWNGRLTTSDPYVPSGDWAHHTRLHQYSGGHNETYGGVTLNIDGDYLDGATAGATAPPVAARVPALSVQPGPDGAIHLTASWSGASGISGWRVLGGARPSALARVGHAANRGTKTAIAVHSSFPWFAVQAIGSGGKVLGTSRAVATPAYTAVYGRSVFASRTGLGGVPAGCFTGKVCHIALTISAGHMVISRTGSQLVPSAGGGLLHFALSPVGRTMLARAGGHRLSVRVSVRDRSGAAATLPMTLVRFTTSGSGPRRAVHQSPTVRVFGATHFVSAGSTGGILAGCFSGRPCRITTTITARGTVIARTGAEFLGTNELGYLSFRLSTQGRAMLAAAPGNQLGAHVTLTSGSASASADIALVRF